MIRRNSTLLGIWRVYMVVLTSSAAIGMVSGCVSQSTFTRIEQASKSYNAGDYTNAYKLAAVIARSYSNQHRDTAAYIAGNSAQKLGDLGNAERYLRQASFSTDKQLAGEAAASLGLVYAQLGQYDVSAKTLLRAAEMLEGEDKAKAFFYAAVSLQKLGRWAQARTNLILARASSDEPSFRQQINDQLSVTGYTLQVGAFRDDTNAQRVAKAMTQKSLGLQIGSPRLVTGADQFGRVLTLVQVGEFATFNSAMHARDRFADSNIIIVPLASKN